MAFDPISLALSKGYTAETVKGMGAIKGDKGDPGPAGPAGPAGANGASGEGVPPGGTTGQVLTKGSDTDYDTQWSDPTGGGGSSGDVYSTEEKVVGRWIDNKTVYQKTIVFNNVTIAGGSNVSIYEIDSIDTLCSGQWCGSYSYEGEKSICINGKAFYSYARKSINVVNDFTQRTFAFSGTVTIQYTKTTDQATIELPSLLTSISDDVTPIQTTATTSEEIKNEEV